MFNTSQRVIYSLYCTDLNFKGLQITTNPVVMDKMLFDFRKVKLLAGIKH